MVFSLFKREIEQEGRPNIEKGMAQVYNTLVRGLKEMERQGCDRLVLTLYESEPDPEVRGRFIEMGETRYYPFEMLDKAEQETIRAHNHYTVVSLVREDVGRIRSYPSRGLEIVQRTAISPLLPKLLDATDNLKYVTKIGGSMGKDALVRFLRESGANKVWSPEAIEQRVKHGIKEYKATTRRLMESEGVHKSIETMEQRQYTPFEQIMIDMRSGIDKASKGGN